MLLLVTALVLAACGGTDATPDTSNDKSTASGQPADQSASADADETTTTQTDSEEAVSDPTPDSIAPQEEAPTEEAAPLDRLNGPFPDSEFPDAVVEDLAGGQVNVKYLGAETKPVLLWFWAPH
jgi:hypothetical protein